MYKEAMRPTWVEINVSNLEFNLNSIKERVGEREIIAVIKADAYGHGAVGCAKVLIENGVKIFAVANLREAVQLRDGGIKEDIIILDMIPDMYDDIIIEKNFIPTVCTFDGAYALAEKAKEEGKIARVMIDIDTGMGRIGYLTDESNIEFAIVDIRKISELEDLKIFGMFSHIATADEKNKVHARTQRKKFDNFCNLLKEEGIEIPIRTLANSASIIDLPDTYYDAVRPGVILYGCYPSENVDKRNLEIKPVMSVKTHITYLKTVGEDFAVGYGRKYITDRESKIATISIGYADGFPRIYSADAWVIVDGVKCPILGNICMDRTMIDVTEVPNVKVGDPVTIMGTQGDQSITAEDIARSCGTINYEICCNFGHKLPRVYVK